LGVVVAIVVATVALSACSSSETALRALSPQTARMSPQTVASVGEVTYAVTVVVVRGEEVVRPDGDENSVWVGLGPVSFMKGRARNHQSGDGMQDGWLDPEFVRLREVLGTCVDRRIGQRHDAGEMAMRWAVADNSIGPLHRRAHFRTGVLLDVSVTGLLMRASTAADVQVGATLVIEAADESGPVTVRRMVDAADEPGQRLYGLEFALGSEEMARRLYEHVVDEEVRRYRRTMGDAAFDKRPPVLETAGPHQLT
jgi:hypothetical protein